LTIIKVIFTNEVRKMPLNQTHSIPSGQQGLTEAVAPSGARASNNADPTPWVPSPEELDELARQSQRLEEASPEEIIRWAVETYFPKLTMATAFGPEGCVILSMLAAIEPRVYVFNLETGYQFRETLELRDRIARRYGIEVDLRKPELTVEQYEAKHGGPLYRTNSHQCCFDRKVKVLHQAVVGYRAWMSGIRRDQSAHRAATPIVGWDKKFNLVKISPLANWTNSDVWKRIVDEEVPYNPLHDKGYPSIGCWPCTRAVLFGEDERAGRWSGTARTECGLHTADDNQGEETQ
jgi:phosphoadenosine phosphosulfate reductase